MYVTIDASEFNTVYEFHEIIKEKLNFPDSYKHTLAGLWDCLLNHCEMPLTLYWTDFQTSRELLGKNADALVDLFNEAQEEIEDFSFELED